MKNRHEFLLRSAGFKLDRKRQSYYNKTCSKDLVAWKKDGIELAFHKGEIPSLPELIEEIVSFVKNRAHIEARITYNF